MSIPETTTPLLRNIDAAQAQLGGIGRTKIYELIATGKLNTVKIGRRTFIPQAQLDSYVLSITVGGALG